MFTRRYTTFCHPNCISNRSKLGPHIRQDLKWCGVHRIPPSYEIAPYKPWVRISSALHPAKKNNNTTSTPSLVGQPICWSLISRVFFVGQTPWLMIKPSQEPKLEVPTICQALCKGYVRGYTPKIWPEIWYVYVPPCIGSWRIPVEFSGWNLIPGQLPRAWKMIHHSIKAMISFMYCWLMAKLKMNLGKL